MPSDRTRGEASDGKRQREKLSARIIAIAEPWIKRLGPQPPLPAVQFAYHTCEALWNISRVEDAAEREAIVGKLRERVVAIAPNEAKSEMRQLFDLMYDRALAAWPEDRRLIASLKVVDLGGGSFWLDVVSVTGQQGSGPI